MCDSGSGFEAVGNYNFFSAIAKIDPSVVKAIYAKDYAKIGLSGSVMNDDGSRVTADLTVAFEFFTPYETDDGKPVTITVATGPNVNCNFILGLPWIEETGAILDTKDQVLDVRDWNAHPFPLVMRTPACHVPVDNQSNAAVYETFIRNLEELDAQVLSASDTSGETPVEVESAAVAPPAKKQKVAALPSALKKATEPRVKFEVDVFGVRARDALDNYVEPGLDNADENASL